MPGFLNLCGIQHFAGTKMLEEGRFCHARGGAHGQKSGKTQNKDICKADVLILWKGWLKSIFWGACYEADKRGGAVPPAFWPAAQAEFISAGHLKSKGWSRPLGGGTHKKRTSAKQMSFSCGARGGSRTRTPLRALAPEASESTNSTTRAEVKRAVP